MEKKTQRIRCGICRTMNYWNSRFRLESGECMECGWCHGLSLIHIAGSRIAYTRRRRPEDGLIDGYAWQPEVLREPGRRGSH
jgi:hypothetical protein